MAIPYVPNLMSVLTATNVISQVLRQKALDALNKNGSVEDSMFNIETPAGSTVQLPCKFSSPFPGDSLRLILWFKDSVEKPIYTLDVRDKPPNEAVHWSDYNLMEHRAYLHLNLTHGALEIERLQMYDAGIYLCRVDSMIQPSYITSFNLTITAPPEKPIIYAHDGREVRLKLGPYKLGQPLTIKCEVLGGNPSPEVTWWRDHEKIDEHSEQRSEYKVTNVLTILTLHRSDLHSIFTCQARNTNDSLPVSTSVKLDMTFGPESVHIVGLNHPMSAGQRYNIQCVAFGSRPVPTITWWNGRTIVNGLQTKFESRDNGNITTSTISLRAPSDWHNTTISCRAAIPGLADTALEVSQVLNIHYMNSAHLALGSSVNSAEFNEGDDAYLECQVDSNPAPLDIVWEKDGAPVSQEIARINKNQTLVIFNIDNSSSGIYSCIPHNREGSAVSNTLTINCTSCAFEEESENRLEIVGNYQISENKNFSVQLDWEFNNIDKEDQIGEKVMHIDREVKPMSMSMLNLTLLFTAVACCATILLTVICLVCVYCVTDKRNVRRKNQTNGDDQTEYCSPDILMSLAGAEERRESLVDEFPKHDLQTFRCKSTENNKTEQIFNQKCYQSPSQSQAAFRHASPTTKMGNSSLKQGYVKTTSRRAFDFSTKRIVHNASKLNSLQSLSEASLSDRYLYTSDFAMTLSRETIV